MAAIIRIRNELKKINKNPSCNCSANPCNDNLMCWDAIIMGPVDTPFDIL